jgi:hypothetical protein
MVNVSWDGWSSSVQDPYNGAKGHYIDDNWVLQNRLISFSELEGSHSGENAANDLYKLLKLYDIRSKVS